MKLIGSFLFLLCGVTSLLAQPKDIEIFEKKDGNKNIVVARNIGKVSYMVTINITATGMDVTPSMKVEAVIPGGYMKEMASLVPRPGESWSYGYEVSFMEYAGQSPKSPATSPDSDNDEHAAPILDVDQQPQTQPQASLSTAPIIVYSKAGCSRCSFVKKEMKAKGIAFEEVDVNGGSAEAGNMWKQLRDGGFTGDSVTMPVVRVDGKYHYNISDLPGFVEKLK